MMNEPNDAREYKSGARAELRVWRIASGLAVLQSAYALVRLLSERSAEAGGRIFGYSGSKLAIAAALLLFTLLFAGLLLVSWWKPETAARPTRALATRFRRRPVWAVALLAALSVFLLCVYLVSLIPDIQEPFTSTLLARLAPVLAWLGGLSAEATGLLVVLRRDEFRARDGFWRPFLLFLFLFGLVFILWGWVARNTLAAESNVTGWYGQGVPILDTQVPIAWAAGLVLLFLLYGLWGSGHPSVERQARDWRIWFTPGRVDFLVCIVLWVAAVLLWNSTPVQTNWFVAAPRTPNFEPYPNSDALKYDLSAQTLLAGQIFTFDNTPFVRRPMYAFLLVIFHWLGDPQYERVVFFQILFLALLPVVGYLLGARLYNRFAAFIFAVFIILREYNAIAIANTVTDSHVKAIMSELPAMLGVLAGVYFAVLWLQEPRRRPLYALLSGGAMGFALLVRLETGMLLLGIALVSALHLRKRRAWAGGMLWTILGVALLLVPWVWRNYSLTGLVFIDSPVFRFDLFSKRYQEQTLPGFITPEEEFPLGPEGGVTEAGPTTMPALPPDETSALPGPTQSTGLAAGQAPAGTPPAGSSPPADASPPTPVPSDEFVASSAGNILQFIRENSAQVTRFVLSHYANSQTQALLIAPSSIRIFDSSLAYFVHRDNELFWFDCCSLKGYVRRLPYWHKWDGQFLSQSFLPLAVNLIVTAAGMTIAWRRNRWVGLIPASVLLVLLGINAVVRNSGGRYLVPVDWASLLYYSIGLAFVTLWFAERLTTGRITTEFRVKSYRSMHDPAGPVNGLSWRSPAVPIAVLGLLMIGFIPPILEKSVQSKYSAREAEQMLSSFWQSENLSSQDRQQLQEFLTNGGTVIAGRGLYPRYFRPGEGEPGSNNPLGPQPYARLGFYVVGTDNRPVVFPMNNPPAEFPHTADVLVFACPQGDSLAAAVFDSSGRVQQFYTRSPFPQQMKCPFDERLGEN